LANFGIKLMTLLGLHRSMATFAIACLPRDRLVSAFWGVADPIWRAEIAAYFPSVECVVGYLAVESPFLRAA
jgi:hypothetical protein